VWPGEAPLPSTDLVTISYLLGELAPEAAGDLVARACARAGVVLVVEPGTPAGHRRVIEARSVMIERGLRIVAPCPHAGACPMSARHDWCHFASRINRSALHRRLKAGELAYEDEKFSYVVGSAFSTGVVSGRVVRHPVFRKGLVALSVCSADGGLAQELVSKRQGARYRSARDARWGSSWPPQLVGTPDVLSANGESANGESANGEMDDTPVDPR
jgi:ribosomal protein RSM22 (predicted rRNA methylase)